MFLTEVKILFFFKGKKKRIFTSVRAKKRNKVIFWIYFKNKIKTKVEFEFNECSKNPKFLNAILNSKIKTVYLLLF